MATPLWLAIVLPALPLQLAARALEQPGPLAIVEGPAQRPWIAFCNDDARAAGIAPGLKLAAAQALAAELIAVERKPEVERDALHELACWGYQFSAQISLRHSGLLLETGASETLFGGRKPLHRHIARGLRELGYTAAFGYAATPRAAWLIGRARSFGIEARDPLQPAHLQDALAPLPLSTLDWDENTTATLHALGLATIGDVLRLPRDAFAKRFGAPLLDDLDRALGRQPDPQPLFAPPEFFDARLELPADVTDAEQLMFPAHRLLRALEGFLRGRNAGTTELVFTAQHSARQSARRAAPLTPTRIALPLAAPERDAARLAKLLAERLARVALPEPAITLALRVEHLAPFAAVNASWLPPAPGNGSGTDWLQLAETLHARLGSERVFQLQLVDDHRPEHAYRIVPLAVDANERSVPTRATPQRPLLLVESPQPLACREETPNYGGPLALVAGPERIESGWWDLGTPHRRTVHRDYFVARNPRGQTLWVYRELAAPRGWFLHGFFS
ncbi:MAG: Y-family DNA polymerase [Gemmatimonadota bacterium]